MTSEVWILNVVQSFYDKAKTDILIGYHFRVIHDFDSHIPRIATFWELQLLGKASRVLTEPFDMMNVHLPLKVKPGELGRWLILFRKTLDEQIALNPEFQNLREDWEERLKTFEGIFKKFIVNPND
jgi:truncated hemoglobin YjbI